MIDHAERTAFVKDLKGGTLRVSFPSPWTAYVSGKLTINGIAYAITEHFERRAYHHSAHFEESENDRYTIDDSFSFKYSNSHRDAENYWQQAAPTDKARNVIRDAVVAIIVEAFTPAMKNAARDRWTSEQVEHISSAIDSAEKELQRLQNLRALVLENSEAPCGKYASRSGNGDSLCPLHAGHDGNHRRIDTSYRAH